MDKSIYSIDYAIFLACLKQVRKAAGLTQAQLAERIGASQSLVSKCERGERRLDVVELARICEALGLTLTDFSFQLTAALANRRFEKESSD